MQTKLKMLLVATFFCGTPLAASANGASECAPGQIKQGSTCYNVGASNIENIANAGSSAKANAIAGAVAAAIGGNTTVSDVLDAVLTATGGAGGQGGAGGKGGNGFGGAGGQGGVGQGGAGGKATSTARGGDQRQGQRLVNRPVTKIDASTRIKQAAAPAAASGLAVCDGEYAQSSFSTSLLGMNIAKCVKDRFAQVLVAEERAKQGDTAGAVYLAGKDKAINRWAREKGYTETSADRRAREAAQKATARSLPYSTCEWRDGRPYIVAKAGMVSAATAACMAALGV